MQLATDPEGEVKRAIALNPHTPISILEQFANEGDRAIQQALLNNRSLPDCLIEPLARKLDNGIPITIQFDPYP
ncbi:MAG: hypothetical protein F6K32_15145 [Desertifilum sp. SIO1I2]|nr:hypothetical protein [Desertifilum sp. SIO1I2]